VKTAVSLIFFLQLEDSNLPILNFYLLVPTTIQEVQNNNPSQRWLQNRLHLQLVHAISLVLAGHELLSQVQILRFYRTQLHCFHNM